MTNKENQKSEEELKQIKEEKVQEMMSEKSNSDFPDEPVTLTAKKFSEVTDEYPLVVVDCWAEWCPPCKALEPRIEELAEELSGKIVFGKLNVDENKNIAQKFGVSAIPTLLVMKDGEEIDRMVGLSSKESLKKKLLNYVD
ncbi:MAG: thioredoxin [Hadesarchaea archaeon]|nr:thioredoxin [Hadesarchaea archaeon]